MGDEFGRQAPDRFAGEVAAKHRVRTPAQVDGHPRLGLVHGQHETVAVYADLAAKRLSQRLSQGERHVLDGVVLVHFQVPVAADGQREAAVLAELLQHVVEKADARTRVGVGFLVQVHADEDGCFPGPARDVRPAGIVQNPVNDFLPAQVIRAVRGNLEAAQAEIRGQLQVGVPVADHRRAGPVQIGGGQKIRQQSRPWFPAATAIVLKMRTVEFLGEFDSL